MQPEVNAVESHESEAPIEIGREPTPEIRIIIVDGDDYFREMLSNELSEQGFAVTTFS